MKKVRDISKWNTVTNYASVVKESDGVIVRIAYRGSSTGKIVADPSAEAHINGLLKNNCPIGIYFFDNAITKEEAIEEAEYCIQFIKKNNLKLSFPVIIDSEYGNKEKTGRADKLSKEKRTDNILAFIDVINKAGYQAAIYASDSWFVEHLEFGRVKNCKRWVAAYNDSKSLTYNKKSDIIGHQYTNCEACNGVGTVDTSDWFDEIGTSSFLLKEEKEEVVSTPAKKFKDGDKVTLKFTNIYASSTTEKVANTKSGTYYIWSNVKRNGRIRITTKKEYVKENGKVTGWVNVSDL